MWRRYHLVQRRSLGLLVASLVLAFAGQPASAEIIWVGIINGDFEGATSAPWKKRGGDGRRLCIRTPPQCPHPLYGRYVGVMGPAVGANNLENTFDCTAPGKWCEVTFDAFVVPGNAANLALAVISNANGTRVFRVPAGLSPPGGWTIAISRCQRDTTVQFFMINAAMAHGIFLVDNVACTCEPVDNSDVPPGSPGDIPQDLPPPEDVSDVTDPDCNANGIPDILDVLEGASQDQNNDGIPDECECPWDLDGSGSVGAADLLSLLVSWGPCKGCPADFDGNGVVGASDLLALLVNWGPCP